MKPFLLALALIFCVASGAASRGYSGSSSRGYSGSSSRGYSGSSSRSSSGSRGYSGSSTYSGSRNIAPSKPSSSMRTVTPPASTYSGTRNAGPGSGSRSFWGGSAPSQPSAAPPVVNNHYYGNNGGGYFGGGGPSWIYWYMLFNRPQPQVIVTPGATAQPMYDGSGAYPTSQPVQRPFFWALLINLLCLGVIIGLGYGCWVLYRNYVAGRD